MPHPFDQVQWSRRPARIEDEDGRAIYVRDEVEAPADWSDSAVNVVASRYFRDDEHSVRQLLTRVGGTVAGWVAAQGLGRDGYEEDLLGLLLHQRGAFNSPVWFNAGAEAPPQCSACFILSVKDSLTSILDLARVEGLIFQKGSGCGTNLSPLRSSREPIAGGGAASGPVSFMRGYDAFAGVVKSGGRTRRAAKMQILDVEHPDILDFIEAKPREERKARALVQAGYAGGLNGEAYLSVAFQNSNLSVRVGDDFLQAVREGKDWTTRAVRTGEPVETFPARDLMRRIAQGAWECGDPGLQYATTIDAWHTCPASGAIHASNPCGEYLFLDDTACNLASLNLLKYLRDGAGFDVDLFRADVATAFTAMEAIVDESSYPTERIGERSRRFRPLGLGYANLGALLLSLGLPYDSDEGRGWAAAITALLSGEAYRVSAAMAKERGAFAAFPENREPFLAVLERHRAALGGVARAPDAVVRAAREAWDAALDGARKHGVRNAQATVIAPTGTIAFLMDCDTTGIEPDLSLVKYKRLAGGGTLRLTNAAVPRALRRLGYPDEAIARMVAHVDAKETIEGAPGLRDEHLPVFDCAFRPHHGTRAIRPDGHLLMMASVQPFLSGGISKTVNLPEDTSIDEIERIYLEGGALGLKAVAVYRENSKGAQVLEQGHCVVDAIGGGCCD